MENKITIISIDSWNDKDITNHEGSKNNTIGAAFHTGTIEHKLQAMKFFEEAKFKKAFMSIDTKPKRFKPFISINILIGIGLLLFIMYFLISKYILIN